MSFFLLKDARNRISRCVMPSLGCVKNFLKSSVKLVISGAEDDSK